MLFNCNCSGFSAVDKSMIISGSVSSWETWVDVDVWTDGATYFIFHEHFFEYGSLEQRGRVTKGK